METTNWKRVFKTFISFLKQNNALDQFINNFDNDPSYRRLYAVFYNDNDKFFHYIKTYIIADFSHKLIEDAFSWHESGQDIDWGALSDKWEILCVKFLRIERK